MYTEARNALPLLLFANCTPPLVILANRAKSPHCLLDSTDDYYESAIGSERKITAIKVEIQTRAVGSRGNAGDSK